jgi:hypothetical protein
MTDVPPPTTVSVVPEIEITEVVADEYVKLPASEPETVGAVTVNVESPKVLLTPLQAENVGVILLITNENVAVEVPEVFVAVIV